MVSTRTTKQSKSPAKQPAIKAGGKSHKRKADAEDTNDESEAESLSDEAIQARVQSDLAKLEARKKAKAKPSKAEAELAKLKKVRTIVPKPVKCQATGTPGVVPLPPPPHLGNDEDEGAK